uniref:Uncharacterized protein n=1 Tax=Arundo donax TaxID=35708 RepID=A0A0A8YTY3_ARUDO
MAYPFTLLLKQWGSWTAAGRVHNCVPEDEETGADASETPTALPS